jgi:hypothetical protein
MVMENYCTHTSAEVQRSLKPKRRRRFHFHFTPTASPWINEVECFVALITGRMTRPGTFHSTDELEQAIYNLAYRMERLTCSIRLGNLDGRYPRQRPPL